MGIRELVKKYGITIYGEDKIRVSNVSLMRKDKAEETIKSQKAEIMSYLKEKKEEERRAAEERQAKINSIEGLAEIKSAIQEQIKWKERFNRSWERGDGFVGLGQKPEDKIAELKQKYPRAAAYLVAESESYKSNYELAEIGRKALESIINGDDYEKVLKEMNDAKKAFVEKHMWD